MGCMTKTSPPKDTKLHSRAEGTAESDAKSL